MQPASLDRWTTLTRVYLALLALRLLMYTVKYAAPGDFMTSRYVEPVHVYVQFGSMGLGIAVGLLWLYRAWSRVPEPLRKSWNGRPVTPRDAVLRLFFPFYNLYWIFVANVGLCSAIDAHLASVGKPTSKAPTTFALVCCVMTLVPVANLLLGPFFWGAFMAKIDAVQAEAVPT